MSMCGYLVTVPPDLIARLPKEPGLGCFLRLSEVKWDAAVDGETPPGFVLLDAMKQELARVAEEDPDVAALGALDLGARPDLVDNYPTDHFFSGLHAIVTGTDGSAASPLPLGFLFNGAARSRSTSTSRRSARAAASSPPSASTAPSSPTTPMSSPRSWPTFAP